MCTVPIAIGMVIGATTSAATGGDLKDIALSSVIGGATAHFSPGSFGIDTTAKSISIGGILGATAVGLGVGYVQNQVLKPPEIPDFPQQATPVAFQSTDPIKTTGSGGKQAAASLAEAVRRSKKRGNLTQDDVADLSIDTSSFASQGLQLA